MIIHMKSTIIGISKRTSPPKRTQLFHGFFPIPMAPGLPSSHPRLAVSLQDGIEGPPGHRGEGHQVPAGHRQLGPGPMMEIAPKKNAAFLQQKGRWGDDKIIICFGRNRTGWMDLMIWYIWSIRITWLIDWVIFRTSIRIVWLSLDVCRYLMWKNGLLIAPIWYFMIFWLSHGHGDLLKEPSKVDSDNGLPGKLQLVGGWFTPLKNMSSSIGMMTFPILMGKSNWWQPKPPTSWMFCCIRLEWIMFGARNSELLNGHCHFWPFWRFCTALSSICWRSYPQ